MSSTFNTTTLALIATGGTRRVYQHPEHPDRCIKVAFNAAGSAASKQEQRYYHYLQRTRPRLEYHAIPLYFGQVATTSGSGHVFELLQDQPGNAISQTLVDVLDSDSYAASSIAWDSALKEFRSWLLNNAVMTTDMTPLNICVQRRADTSLRLVVVDGIGHNDKLPWVQISRTLARMKLNRHFKRRGLLSMRTLLEQTHYFATLKANNQLYRKYPPPAPAHD